MVGDAVLRKVVGPDLLAAVAGLHHAAAQRAHLGVVLGPLHLQEPAAQHHHRLVLVLELALLVLAGHDQARWEVRDPHRRVGRIHALSAMPGGAVDVHAQVLFTDVDVDLFGLGHDRHCGGRGVDAAARFRHRDALHAMDPALELQPAVGAPAADLEDDLLEAMHAVLAGAHHFHTPAASL